VRTLRNKNAPPTAGLVQKYIDTAYDNILLVANNIDALVPLGTAYLAGELEQRPLASQAEAEGKTENTKVMTSLRVAQQIALGSSGLQGNYTATTNPTVTDDVNAGYVVGSVWINLTADDSFKCADNTAGAAVWVLTSLSADDLSTVAVSGNSDDLIQGSTQLLMTVAERDALALVEPSATADQTDSEITIAYGNVVAVVGQAEAEAGASTVVRRWTAERVGQAIAALAAGSSSPLTTKGDLLGYSTVDARLPVGTDGQFVAADSAETLGIKWVDAPSGTVPNGTNNNDSLVWGGAYIEHARGGWTPTVSSTFAGSAANLIDGNTGTDWHSNSGNPQWFKIDAGSAIDVSRMTITPVNNQNNANAILESSPDDSVWTQRGTSFYIARGTVPIVMEFTEVSARYWRVTTTDGSYIQISEYELAYGVPAWLVKPAYSINSQTGTAYEAVLADADNMISMDNAAANTFTIPAESAVDFIIGTKLDVWQKGAGQTTIALTTDTLIGNTKINAQNEVVSVVKVAAATWLVIGGVA
jgi:hypothetical protein